MEKIFLLLAISLVMPGRAICEEASDCFRRGNEKFKSGDTNGAMTEFNRVIELEPTYLFAYPNRAFLRQAKGDYDGAIADFDKAIALKPDFLAASRFS